jgi:hypothetical protein
MAAERESGMIFFFPAGAKYYSCVLSAIHPREDLPYGLKIPFDDHGIVHELDLPT